MPDAKLLSREYIVEVVAMELLESFLGRLSVIGTDTGTGFDTGGGIESGDVPLLLLPTATTAASLPGSSTAEFNTCVCVG